MKIWFSPYSLTAEAPCSHLSPRDGFLLKVEFASSLVGFADLHPIPEFGDPDLISLLRSVDRPQLPRLVSVALSRARQDAEARAEKRSLFADFEIPLSHALIMEPLNLPGSWIEDKIRQGFKYFKVKMGKNLQEESKWLLQQPREIFWRIDFNNRLDFFTYKSWYESIRHQLQIDFIEDPYQPLDLNTESLGLLALDLGLGAAVNPLAEVFVLKPARQAADEIRTLLESSSQRIVFTHALDHPLGQALALQVAAENYWRYPHKREVGGFQSQIFYDEDVPMDWIKYEGPQSFIKKDIGLGLTEYLHDLAWERLV